MENFYFITGELLHRFNGQALINRFRFQVYYGCTDFILKDALYDVVRMFEFTLSKPRHDVVSVAINSKVQVSEKEYLINNFFKDSDMIVFDTTLTISDLSDISNYSRSATIGEFIDDWKVAVLNDGELVFYSKKEKAIRPPIKNELEEIKKLRALGMMQFHYFGAR